MTQEISNYKEDKNELVKLLKDKVTELEQKLRAVEKAYNQKKLIINIKRRFAQEDKTLLVDVDEIVDTSAIEYDASINDVYRSKEYNDISNKILQLNDIVKSIENGSIF